MVVWETINEINQSGSSTKPLNYYVSGWINSNGDLLFWYWYEKVGTGTFGSTLARNDFFNETIEPNYFYRLEVENTVTGQLLHSSVKDGSTGTKTMGWTSQLTAKNTANQITHSRTDRTDALIFRLQKMSKNENPLLVLNAAENMTLYENDTLTIDGKTTDTDTGDVVTVKYQIDSGAVRNLHSAISDGANPIPFFKELTYSEGILKDGNIALTSVLSKDTPHTLSVWAEDGNGGKSPVQTRTFYVVPNRPPTLTVDPIAAQSELINSNTIPVSGTVGDADNNDVVVTFQINDNEPQEVLSGKPGAWNFNIALKDLRTGPNTLTIKASDIYNAEISKVLTINKTHNAVSVNEAIALYKITPPTGSAQKILLWIERMLGDLAISAEISMTNEGEPENFVPLPRTNTGPKDGLQEDEFAYQADSAKTNIVLKIIYNRTDSKAMETIKRISGVLS